MMRTLMTAISALAFMASASTIDAKEIQMGAGSPSGEYTNTIIPAINKALTEEGNYGVKALVTAGSQQNVEDVMSGKLVAALSQLDVAALNLATDENETLALLGKIAPEALLCAARKDGRVKNYNDLTDEHDPPLKVSAGKAGSDMARTLGYLMQLDPEFSTRNVKLLHKKNAAIELSRLASGNRDLVCFVMMPNPDNELVKIVADNKNLFFIEFVVPKALTAEVNNMKIYGVMEVPVSPGVWGFGGEKVRTLVTWVGVVINEDKADEGFLTALSKVLLKPDLLPPTTAAGKARQLFDDFKERF